MFDLDNLRYIYILKDPRDGLPKYLGKTNNVKKRFEAHLSSYTIAKTPNEKWIKELKDLNLRPDLEVIATSDKENIVEFEKNLIKDYKFKYSDLKNVACVSNEYSGYISRRRKAVIGKNITNGSIIRFTNMHEANSKGFCNKNISACIRNKEKSHKNYVWCLIEEEYLLDHKIEVYKKTRNGYGSKKKVKATNIKTNEILHFDGLCDVRSLGFSNNVVFVAIKNNKNYYGYKWEYI